jgi:D-3-phosphoglycerate dehydrogenase
MKYVLFLQNLGLPRDQASALLTEAGCAEAGYQPIWADDADLEAKKDAVEIIVTSKHVVGREELEPYPNARMASLAFTGYNDVDRAYCSSRQPPLQLYYVPGYSTESVAELAAGLALSLLRRLPLAHRRVVAGRWDRSETGETALVPGLELRGRTVGIVGTGTIGMYTAEVFHRGFDCKIVAWSRKPKVEALGALGGTYLPSIDDVFRQADVVSLHLELVPETEHTADARRLALLKPEAILLDVSRTGLVDLQALTEALRQKQFLGAALDVTEEHHLHEGLSDLLELENVILTPHIGFRTDRALERLARITIENIGRFVRGDPTHRLEP